MTRKQSSRTVDLFLCGDVMTGRGIDQILPYPGDPVLYESYVRDACEYVRFAEAVNGSIPQPVDDAYIWGDALEELHRAGTELRIINLETSITTNKGYWPAKGIHYRMEPRNIACLKSAGIDCCALANNHVLDWGYAGLAETVATLKGAGIAFAGAGENVEAARAPVFLNVEGKGRVLVFSLGSPTSGVFPEWAATADRPGVNLLADFSAETCGRIIDGFAQWRHPGDAIILSIHWGSNWGYAVPEEQRHFAHQMIDAGVSIIHGHSSHHVRPAEIYRNRLILYGCGDFVNDYEGISGHEAFRGELALMYLPKIDLETGGLVDMKLMPMRLRRFRLQRASSEEAAWLAQLVNALGGPYHTQAELQSDWSIRLFAK